MCSMSLLLFGLPSLPCSYSERPSILRHSNVQLLPGESKLRRCCSEDHVEPSKGVTVNDSSGLPSNQ